ncbi:MAG TPA: hypothetical protein VJL39_01020, partial [Candidatus Paceibacterota bacterium]
FDAEVLETVFEPTFKPEDLVNLGIGQIYLTLMIDGVGSPPFSAETIPPIETPPISYRDDVVTRSRDAYGRSRADVEAAISKKQLEFIPPPREKKPARGDYGRTNGRSEGSWPRAATQGSYRADAAPQPRETLQREEAPRPEAPRPPRPMPEVGDPRRTREAEGRNALRDAISKARTDEEKSAPRAVQSEPVRSPADVLRAKRMEKEQRREPERPREERGPKIEPKKESAAPPEPRIERAAGEVSHDVLSRVISGDEKQGG